MLVDGVACRDAGLGGELLEWAGPRRAGYPPPARTSTDPTTVQLTWSGSPKAAGYRVWVRDINDGSQSSADEFIVDTTHRGIA